MIIDGEYPATHSMATAWYMVDDDGNVGIMQFDDNGPVPFEVRGDAFANDLLFGEGLDKDERCGMIHLNAEQVKEILKESRELEFDEEWYSDVILKIDKKRIPEFLEIVNDISLENRGCISEELGLYRIDLYGCVNNEDGECISKKDFVREKLAKSGIVLSVYDIPMWDLDSVYDKETDEVKFTKTFENCPYYIYLQPYWIGCLQKRMNVPVNPVKISQVEETCRDRILQIPGKFKDLEYMQIARWFPSNVYVCPEHEAIVDYNEYARLVMEDGEYGWFLSAPWRFPYRDFCPKRKSKFCKETYMCTEHCVSNYSNFFAAKPTIIHVMAPFTKMLKESYEIIQQFRDIVSFSYVPKYPLEKEERKSYYPEYEGLNVSKDELVELFGKSKGWFELVMQYINPRVILIDDGACEVFNSVFPIESNSVVLNGLTYPIYKISESVDNMETIRALYKLPFQGKMIPHFYSLEEMEELINQGMVYD